MECPRCSADIDCENVAVVDIGEALAVEVTFSCQICLGAWEKVIAADEWVEVG